MLLSLLLILGVLFGASQTYVGGTYKLIMTPYFALDFGVEPKLFILPLFTIQIYVFSLIDPESNLSYVTPYFAFDFWVKLELLMKHFSIVVVGVPIIASRVYRSLVVVVKGWETIADLFELEIVDLDVIMGFDWLSACYNAMQPWSVDSSLRGSGPVKYKCVFGNPTINWGVIWLFSLKNKKKRNNKNSTQEEFSLIVEKNQTAISSMP